MARPVLPRGRLIDVVEVKREDGGEGTQIVVVDRVGADDIDEVMVKDEPKD